MKTLEQIRPDEGTSPVIRVLGGEVSAESSFLRTTRLLERLNRMLRHLFRAAGAYHATVGLLAIVARILNPLRLI